MFDAGIHFHIHMSRLGGTMHRKASLASAAVSLILLASVTAMAQEDDPTEEIRSMLHIASGLLPQIDKNQQPSMAFNISGQQTRIGDLAGALATLQRVKDEHQEVWVASSIASSLAWQGRVPLALTVVRSSGKGDAQGRAQAYASIAGTLAERGAFDESLGIVKLIEDGPDYLGRTSLLVQTLMVIQSKQWAAGDETAANNTLNAALEAVEREKESPFTPEFAETMPAQTYGGIVGELAREGNRAAAYAVLERLYDIVADSAGPSKEDLLYTLSAAQANLGDFELALETAAQMDPGEKRDNALFIVALERTQHGDPQGALDLALGLSVEFSRDASLRSIADAIAASGNYIEALSTIDRIRGAGEHAYGLSELAFERAENDDPAAGLLTQIAWDAARNAGRETKPYVFAQIAVAKGMTGDFNHSLEIINAMADQDRFWAVQSLAEILVHAGKKTEAIALAESQQSAYPKACAYLGMASQLIAEEREAASRNQRNQP